MKEAPAFLRTLTPPYVIKADGLAAGKGVLIIDDIHEAEKEIECHSEREIWCCRTKSCY